MLSSKIQEKWSICEIYGENASFRKLQSDKLGYLSSQPRYDHFDISPSMLNPVLEYNDYSIFHRTGRPVMSCCGARNFRSLFASQNFDRCHSLRLAASASGSAR